MFADHASGGGFDPELMRIAFRQIAACKTLSAADNLKMLADYRQTHDPILRKKIVTANLRLVVWTAMRWRNRGLPLPDLIQEGVFGLTRAVDLFDPQKNVRFSTYAVPWISESMQLALMNQARQIRLPVSRIRALNRLWVRQVQGKKAEPQSSEERELLKLLNDTSIARPALSDDPDAETWEVRFADPELEEAETVTDREKFYRRLAAAVSPWFEHLNPEQKRLLWLRYGNGEKIQSIAFLANALNKSADAVHSELIALMQDLRLCFCKASLDADRLFKEHI